MKEDKSFLIETFTFFFFQKRPDLLANPAVVGKWAAENSTIAAPELAAAEVETTINRGEEAESSIWMGTDLTAHIYSSREGRMMILKDRLHL